MGFYVSGYMYNRMHVDLREKLRRTCFGAVLQTEEILDERFTKNVVVGYEIMTFSSLEKNFPMKINPCSRAASAFPSTWQLQPLIP
mmetsp:Transcript_30238/g.49287  ORF Transcript_30238/g.49287 Transcript_30238/m.49287 type:complete len:86 (+) Transcript_30238:74-331(+)